MTDLVSHLPANGQSVTSTKDQLHYLLHQKRMLEVPGSGSETIARIDGAIVMDDDAQLLAFGAILRHRDLSKLHPENIEKGH